MCDTEKAVKFESEFVGVCQVCHLTESQSALLQMVMKMATSQSCDCEVQ